MTTKKKAQQNSTAEKINPPKNLKPEFFCAEEQGIIFCIRTDKEFLMLRKSMYNKICDEYTKELFNNISVTYPEILSDFNSFKERLETNIEAAAWHALYERVYPIEIPGKTVPSFTIGWQKEDHFNSMVYPYFGSLAAEVVCEVGATINYIKLNAMPAKQAMEEILSAERKFTLWDYTGENKEGKAHLEAVVKKMKSLLLDQRKIEEDFGIDNVFSGKNDKTTLSVSTKTKLDKRQSGNLAYHFKNVSEYNAVRNSLHVAGKIDKNTSNPTAWLDNKGRDWKGRLNQLIHYLIKAGYTKTTYIAPKIRRQILLETFGVGLHENTCKAEADSSAIKAWGRIIPHSGA